MSGLNEVTISKLQQMYQDKSVSIKEVTKEYIDRIHKVDEGEDGLNSVLEINPDALLIADELDRKGNDNHSLLYGVPVLIKDNIATADRMHTSAGSVALADSVTTYDAELVKVLRDQGAVILGKTNMTEYANYMAKNMSNGYSSRGGQVDHPYVKGKDPSGSSSGSAVAVSANLCTASIGSDTCNSIVAPGVVNGIVGLRPSTGVISQKGIIPISFTLDTAGPFTRTVADSAIMFAGLTGTNPITSENDSVKGKIIGYNDWISPEEPEDVLIKTEEVVKELEKAGAIIKKIVIPKTQYIMDVMRYEFKYAMNQYLKTLPDSYPIRTLQDIIEYNRQHPEKALKFGQYYLEDAQDNISGSLNEIEYKEILRDRKESMARVREQIKDVDLCLMFSFNNILQYVALPVITIPCGLYEDGMPAGIFMTSNTDAALIRHSYAIEKAVGQRVEPRDRK
jgi:amidase